MKGYTALEARGDQITLDPVDYCRLNYHDNREAVDALLERQRRQAGKRLSKLIKPLVADGGCDVIVAVDRSGSTLDPRIATTQQTLLNTLVSSLNRRGARVSVFAFLGAENSRMDTPQALIHPLKPLDGKGNLESLKQIGGGGTPTAGAIRYVRDQAEI